MDIKNLLCPHASHDDSICLDNQALDKPPVARSWSSASSFASSPLSSYSSLPSLTSPTSPTLSPPSSPASLAPAWPVDMPSAPQSQRYTPQTRTPWTPQEDFMLQQGYRQGLSWAMISATYLPHRSRGCCWGRFKTLQSKAMEQRPWSAEEDRLLLMAIKKHSAMFKQAWKSVTKDMGDRSWKECEIRSTRMAPLIRKHRHGHQQYLHRQHHHHHQQQQPYHPHHFHAF